MDIEQIVKTVVDNAKTNKWLSCHMELTHGDMTYQLGVKSFGRWVQRLELVGIVSDVPEQKTNKRMAELLTLEIQVLLKSIGAN